jgi:hypothetical protein
LFVASAKLHDPLRSEQGDERFADPSRNVSLTL